MFDEVVLDPVFLTLQQTGSGLIALSHDELIMVEGIRMVKQQGRGEFYLKMEHGSYTVWNCKPDFGNATTINVAMGKQQKS